LEVKKNILIVDDDEATLFSYHRLLRGPLSDVDVCSNLEDALNMLDKKEFNVVITDLRLSHSEETEGLDLLRYLKIHKPSFPVILTTGYGNNEIKEEAYALGAWSYLEKPVPIYMLISILKDIGINVES